jgi:hypothetical protein
MANRNGQPEDNILRLYVVSHNFALFSSKINDKWKF